MAGLQAAIAVSPEGNVKAEFSYQGAVAQFKVIFIHSIQVEDFIQPVMRGIVEIKINPNHSLAFCSKENAVGVFKWAA